LSIPIYDLDSALKQCGKILDSILALIAILMAPAAVVAAIKALWAVGKPGD
jgi:hypothetical protein